MTVDRVVRATCRRIRLQRALNGAVIFAIAGLSAAALVLVVLKSGAPVPSAQKWLAAAALFPLAGALIGWSRPLPDLLAAQLLDRSHGLHDRIASALWFGRLPDTARSDFMQACMADAAAHAAGLKPARALPLILPRYWEWLVALTVAVIALAFIDLPRREPVPRISPAAAPLLLHEDDIQAFASDAAELDREGETPQKARAAVLEYNRLIQEIADRKLERAEALKKTGQLDRRLLDGYPAGLEEMNKGLRQIGRRLEKSRITRSLARPLNDADAARAEREMKKLAEKLKTKPSVPRELDRLRQALRRAAERPRESGGRRLLKRQQRQLEKLRSEQERQQPAVRRLDRLRRQMADAARGLNQGQNREAAEQLQAGAEQLGQMAREQSWAKINQQLRGRLAELRELLRRHQGRGYGKQGEAAGGGKPGETLNLGRFALLAGGGGKPRERDKGDNRRDSRKARLLVPSGRNGAKGVIAQTGRAVGISSERSPGTAPGGSGAGDAAASQMLDKATQMQGTRVDTRIEGEHARGPTRSEVILESADRGFVSRNYRGVFTDYRNHAESVLERDAIPPGYRFYVKRYFQLIRPREDR